MQAEPPRPGADQRAPQLEPKQLEPPQPGPQHPDPIPTRQRPAASSTAEQPLAPAQQTPPQARQPLPKSPGDPLGAADRAHFETGFQEDLGDVRIHRDPDAAVFADSAGANAVTVGRDIYFAPGAYSPALLAHEISHVLQQRNAVARTNSENALLEREADTASADVLGGRLANLSAPTSVPTLQRQPAPEKHLRLMPTDSLVLDNFAIDGWTVNDHHQRALEEFSARVKDTLTFAADTIITIVGFTDAPGTQQHNLYLGDRRANAVRDYLIEMGIPASSLRTSSLGENLPRVPSNTYEARNRRVEIDVIQRSLRPPLHLLTPTPSLTGESRKPIDLTYHPHDPTPDEDFREKYHQIEQALREAQEYKRAHPGTSIADLTGRAARNLAKKLGLPQWAQDRAESLGKDLPAAGAGKILDNVANDTGMDTNTKNALEAIFKALAQMKVQ